MQRVVVIAVAGVLLGVPGFIARRASELENSVDAVISKIEGYVAALQ